MVEPESELDLWPRVSQARQDGSEPTGRGPLVSSPLIVQTDAARRPMPGLVAAAIGVALPFASVLGGVAVTEAVRPQTVLGSTLLVSLIALGPLLAAAWIFMSLVEARPRRILRPPLAASIAVGSLLAAIGFGIAVAAPALGHGAIMKAPGLTAPAFVAAFGVMMFQAAGEEVFFRGWLLPIMTSRWGAWIGLIASSLLFAAPHFIGSPLTPLAILNDTLAGVAFGILALRSGGLVAPIAAHFVWNFTEAHLLGAYPNPGLDPLGSVLDLDFVGPAWLTGGEAALNGAAPTTIALLVMAVAAYFFSPRPR